MRESVALHAPPLARLSPASRSPLCQFEREVVNKRPLAVLLKREISHFAVGGFLTALLCDTPRHTDALGTQPRTALQYERVPRLNHKTNVTNICIVQFNLNSV